MVIIGCCTSLQLCISVTGSEVAASIAQRINCT